MLRYLLLSLNILNGLLAAAVAALAYFAVLPVWNPAIRITLPPVTVTTASREGETEPSQQFPMADYAVISERNLFHPDRKIPPEKQLEKVVPKPEVFLYGTLITGDASYAFIEDKRAPYSTEGRGQRQLVLKRGASLSGYIIDKIEANQIVLRKGEEKVVVMLDDRAKRRADESPAVPVSGRQAPVGMVPSHSPSAPPSVPQAVPLPPPAAAPGPRILNPALRPHSPTGASAPPAMPSSAPEAPAAKPGIGASGSWPPTKSSIEQTQQKIQEGRQMRSGQIPQNR